MLVLTDMSLDFGSAIYISLMSTLGKLAISEPQFSFLQIKKIMVPPTSKL